jgi:hypothetical protein
MRRALLAGLAVLALGGPVLAQPIDRHALVSRHAVRLTKVDPSAPLMVGNGQIGFTADITGLQTFPEAYSKIAPLLTEAQWAWHSFPNPEGYTYADGTTPIDVRGTKQPYAYMKDWNEAADPAGPGLAAREPAPLLPGPRRPGPALEDGPAGEVRGHHPDATRTWTCGPAC